MRACVCEWFSSVHSVNLLGHHVGRLHARANTAVAVLVDAAVGDAVADTAIGVTADRFAFQGVAGASTAVQKVINHSSWLAFRGDTCECRLYAAQRECILGRGLLLRATAVCVVDKWWVGKLVGRLVGCWFGRVVVVGRKVKQINPYLLRVRLFGKCGRCDDVGVHRKERKEKIIHLGEQWGEQKQKL